MQEALPKLVYHLHFLQAHPEIKIHYGFTKQPTLPNFVLPHNYFNFLGLADRLINGTVYANKVYMPREGGCQDIGYNAWEALTGRETFLEMLGIHETRDFQVTPTQKPTVLVLTRSPGPYTQNKADYVARRWPKATFGLFLDTLAARFPDHTIEMFSDQNVTLMTCPLCQAAAFHRADVVIGMHGAGLSNMIYMRPNSVVTEVVVNYDSRHIPIVGIFPRLAGIVGVHHYVYYVNKDVGPVDVVDVANQTAAFFNKARMYVPL